ncbi:MAG: hypothetical protein A3K76_01130 [Euryarchaeota archaeon RBG_13_57_23]|nr:MAG: hypothetical protein A3K76_01130 [Euryarchaeota archaeon RBG_13_57_23]
MRQLPLFKFGSRAKSTSLGIALCTMFIVASFSVVNGLGSSMDNLSATFESDYSLITRPGDEGMSYFEELEIDEISDRLALGVVTSARILPYDEMVTVFSVADTYGILPAPIGQSTETVLKSKLDYSLGAITLVGTATLDLTLGGTYSSSLFPSDWLLASQNVTWALTTQVGRYNYAIAESLDDSGLDLLEERGFSVQPMVGIIDFLESGVGEIRSDMSWVLLPSAFVIAVLAYSFIGAEVSDRRHEIGILKTLGAGRLRVMSYLLGDALLISAWGGVLGISLGIVLSYAISTSASAVFTSVFVMRVDEWLVVIAFLATVAAGVLGALLPATRMTISSPVEDLKEVGRSI